jgi:hypothetical protein
MGREVAFRVLAAEGRWVALLDRPRRMYVLVVSGEGRTPERLDMVAIRPDDVESGF